MEPRYALRISSLKSEIGEACVDRGCVNGEICVRGDEDLGIRASCGV